MLDWLLQNALAAVGLFLTAFAIHAHTIELRIQNLFTVSKEHREIWDMLYENPALRRVLDPDLPPDVTPTFEERHFVRELVSHCAKSFRAQKCRASFQELGLGDDIHQFFLKPLPAKIWKSIEHYVPRDFAAFVNHSISGGSRRPTLE